MTLPETLCLSLPASVYLSFYEVSHVTVMDDDSFHFCYGPLQSRTAKTITVLQ